MPATLTRSKRRWFGQIALELYFTQLFQSDAAILDFWPSRLGVDLDGHAVWAPRPLYLSWDPAFLDGVRNVYAGFFLDDGERFRHGLAAVGLNSSPEILLGHLGDGNQRSVRFRRQMLDSTLRRTAGQLGADGIRLHSNFAAFGFGVAALYASLETLDRSFDVRSAFLRSYPEA
jgi:hypothetical protein